MRPGAPERELLGGGRKERGSHQGGLHVLLFVQLTGRKSDQRVRLQLILDETPQALKNKWVEERLQYYIGASHTPRDERIEASALQPLQCHAWDKWEICCGGSSAATRRSRGCRKSRRQRTRQPSRLWGDWPPGKQGAIRRGTGYGRARHRSLILHSAETHAACQTAAHPGGTIFAGTGPPWKRGGFVRVSGFRESTCLEHVLDLRLPT